MNIHHLMIVGVALLIAADKKDRSDVEREVKKLAGAWRVVAVEMNGLALFEEELKKGAGKMTIQGLQLTLALPDLTTRATCSIDPKKKPKTVDARIAEGPLKGTTLLGIYEWKGGTLRACFDTYGKARPKEFSTKDREGWLLMVARREKGK